MKDLTNDIIVHKNINGTEIIQFRRLLEFPNLKHCYTLRKNGINVQVKNGDKTELLESYSKVVDSLNNDEKSNFSSNNLNQENNLKIENIGSIKQMESLQKDKTFTISNIVKPHQTHTDKVEVVNSSSDTFEEVDGVITNKENILLCTSSADCTSLFFYDDEKKVIGDVHSGWRGTLQKIGKKAVEKMISEYDCKPENIICCISPCIKKCHFEVEEEVMQMFKNEFDYTGRIDEIIEKGKVVDGIQKYNIDTTLINKIILAEVGLQESNIIDSNICTVCDSDLFHSFRADGDASGRNGAFIGMM